MVRVQALSYSLGFLARLGRDSIVTRANFQKNGAWYRTTQSGRFFSSNDGTKPQSGAETVSITFIDRDGDKKTVKAKHGELLLDVAKNNDIDLEGACEGTLSCSTCHIIFDPEEYNRLDLEPPTDEELDMLDLAYGLTETSRLGCQIEVTDKLDGITLKIPEATQDARDQ